MGGRVYNQDSAHRRGLVLGLTMAEIMVLLLFSLLLIFASTWNNLQQEIAVKDARIAELVVLKDHLGDVVRNNPDGLTVTDIIQQIKRQEDRVSQLVAEVERLSPYETSRKALDTIIQQMSDDNHESPTTQQIVEKLQEVSTLLKENGTLRGQIAQLSKQIKASGRGNEFPSCWVTSDGKPESIFELSISNSSIRILERSLPSRTEDKRQLPVEDVRYDAELDRFEFVSMLRPLYQWSLDHQCRFYVIRASTHSSARIDLVNAVNGYFYPDGQIQFRPALHE